MSFPVFLSLLSLLVSLVVARTRYADVVPNSRAVVVDGVTVVGLGHPSFTSSGTSYTLANQFGKDCEDAAKTAGNSLLWQVVCEMDSDLDGLTNGFELCDTACTGVAAPCKGRSLTHPGFPPNATDPVIREQISHGILMIVAWMIFAPFGVFRALYYKKRGGKPVWFRDHKIFLTLTVIFTWISFFVIVSYQGTEAILEGSVHTSFGVFVLVLSLVQPISGFLRPHLPKTEGESKTRIRLVWEFQHQWSGRAALVFALICVTTGLPQVYTNGEVWANILIGFFVAISAIASFYVIFFRKQIVRKEKKVDEGGVNVATVEIENNPHLSHYELTSIPGAKKIEL